MRSQAIRDRFDAAVLGAAVFFGVFASNPVFAQFAPPDFTGIVKLKAPAVVAITTRRQIEDHPVVIPEDMPFGEFFRRQQEEMATPGRGAQTRQALGSGFIISPDARDLSRAVTGQKPGQQAVITVYRDGKAQDVATTIGQREEDRPQQTGAFGGDGGKRQGLALAPLSESDRRQRQLPSNIRGVIV